MVLLFRCATGEDWNLVMYELGNTEGYEGVACVELQTYEEMQRDGILGCGNSFALPFFLLFMVLISMLIMNLTVAAVISGLDEANAENSGVVTGNDIEDFIERWKTYDPKATGYITVNDLIFLCYELPEPLGTKKKEVDEDESLENVDVQDKYMFNEKKKIALKNIDALRMIRHLDIQVKQVPKPKIIEKEEQ